MSVSVLMPVYNCAHHLPAAIDSILSQTYRDFEFIIIDDHSTDDTSLALERYQAQDSRIKVYRNDGNLGVAKSLNRGLELAHGEYIARMDADDISLPERFARQVEYLDVHPEIGALGTQTVYIDDDGKFLPQQTWEQPTSPSLILWHLLYGSPLCHPSTIMRADCLQRVGGYDPDYPNEDMHLWTKLAFVTKLMNLDEVLLQYRMGPHEYDEKRIYWDPHIQRVSHQFIERVLVRSVDPALSRLHISATKNRKVDQSTSFLTLFRLCSLLKEIFVRLKQSGLIDGKQVAQVESLVITQTQGLLVDAFNAMKYNQ